MQYLSRMKLLREIVLDTNYNSTEERIRALEEALSLFNKIEKLRYFQGRFDITLSEDEIHELIKIIPSTRHPTTIHLYLKRLNISKEHGTPYTLNYWSDYF